MTINNETMYALEVDGKYVAIFSSLPKLIEYFIEMGYGKNFYKSAYLRIVNVSYTNTDANPIEDNYTREIMYNTIGEYVYHLVDQSNKCNKVNEDIGETDVQSK